MRKLLILSTVVLSSISHGAQEAMAPSCLNPEVRLEDRSERKAYDFLHLEQLSNHQQNILKTFLNLQSQPIGFEQWTLKHNDQAANYLAVTNALGHLEIILEDESHVNGLEMIKNLIEIKGVRLIAKVDQTLFHRWVKSGARYVVHWSDGRNEQGQVKFADHSQKGGGLHCGFDIQGYTHYTEGPYIHWNIRQEDGNSDIHLDGIRPWVGVVPNPHHLSYENSDVRYWMKRYTRKYGNPGFLVSEQVVAQ